MIKKLIIILLTFIFTYLAASYEKYVDFDLIKNYSQPRFVKNGVLFTLPGGKDKTAFLRTDLDNWKNDYYYKNNIYDVLYVFVRYPKESKSFRYRININGFWTIDPNNREIVEDNVGHELSLVTINETSYYSKEYPIIEKNKENIKKVIFRYNNPNAKEVNLVLSVDNWNEYSHSMAKKEDGSWEITKYYSPGKYLYYFFVDGRKIVDLENDNKEYNPEKGQVCYFVIE